MSKGSYLILFAGQSNMVGHKKATTGHAPLNSKVLAWNNRGKDGRWRQAELGHQPFNVQPDPPNNTALHFANRLQRATGKFVYLVGRPVNGSTLLSWSEPDAPNMARFLKEVTASLTTPANGQEIPQVADSILWSQGESDDIGATMVKESKLTTLELYAAGFAKMIACLKQ